MIFFQPSFIIWNCWRTAMTIFVICFEKTPHYPSVPHTRHFSTLLPHKGHSFSAPKISHNHTSNLFGSDGFLWKWRISGAEKERLLCWSDVLKCRVEVMGGWKWGVHAVKCSLENHLKSKVFMNPFRQRGS